MATEPESTKNPVVQRPGDQPLVYISAVEADNQFRDRLVECLTAFQGRIEWWYGLAPDYPNDFSVLMDRTDVAVVLLSPAFLSSDSAKSELLDLHRRAKENKLKLFPIVLEPVRWDDIPYLKGIKVWNWTRPIDDTSDAANDELTKIAYSIVTLAQSYSETKIEPAEQLYFSATATRVIEQAWLFAESSNRGYITSSCLLFGLVEAVPQQSTAKFISGALNQNQRYVAEFHAFLNDAGLLVEKPRTVRGVRWQVSPNVSRLLLRAQSIVSTVQLTDLSSPEIHARHLFAALISHPLVRSVNNRLQRLGVELPALRSDFREYIRKMAPSEDPAAWDYVLGTQQIVSQVLPEPEAAPVLSADPSRYKTTYSAFIPDRAAYGPRATGAPLDDSLGVRTYASHLAQLIAAKDTFMPLSIGLFGAWGAGKSHFIDLLDEQLCEITKDPGRAFHKNIVQIRFNAWHYLDTNLWANLVSEIFDQLFATVEERGEKQALEKLKDKLRDQSALAAEAKAALVVAENVREQAERELSSAMKARAEQENTVSTLLNDLKNLVVDDELKKQLHEVAAGLGLPQVESSFQELEARAEEVRSVSGRFKALLLAVFTGAGWWKRGILLIVALAAPLVVAWLAANGSPWIQNLLAGAGRTIAQFVTVIAAISAWLATQARAGNAVVSKLETAYEKVAKVRAEREATDVAARAQAALEQKKQAEEQARQTLRDAEEKLKTIQAELAEMAPGRQLIRFLRERATAEDYRRHLGLVSLVRRDFEQLSELLTAASSNDEQLPKIDRIVLYIDDLDRCRADRVIEVLEAVHLLLAFPLFAVVVAVDPRWLRQSLLDHYPRLLGGNDDDKSNVRTGSLGRPATPQDYLEKIFQVPFNLHAMEKDGFESLVKHLFTGNGTRPGEADIVTEPPLIPESEPAVVSELVAKVHRDPDDDLLIARVEPESQIISSPDPEPPPAQLDPERLVLTQDEIDDVQRFQLLFQTPRAVKRLANTYSLIRVGVAQTEWDNYLGHDNAPAAYRVPLLLLAVTSAFPALARPWLLWLRETPASHWQLDEDEIKPLADKHRDTTDRADWDKLHHCMSRLDLEGWPAPDHEALAKWVPRVARYSF